MGLQGSMAYWALSDLAPIHGEEVELTKFTAVAKTAELQAGQMKRVRVGRQPILLANVEGIFHALRDRCGHQRAALSKGKLEGETVECPMHFSLFNVKTGKLISGPDWPRVVRFGEALRLAGRLWKEPGAMFGLSPFRADDVEAYEVRIDGDTVLVKL